MNQFYAVYRGHGYAKNVSKCKTHKTNKFKSTLNKNRTPEYILWNLWTVTLKDIFWIEEENTLREAKNSIPFATWKL